MRGGRGIRGRGGRGVVEDSRKLSMVTRSGVGKSENRAETGIHESLSDAIEDGSVLIPESDAVEEDSLSSSSEGNEADVRVELDLVKIQLEQLKQLLQSKGQEKDNLETTTPSFTENQNSMEEFPALETNQRIELRTSPKQNTQSTSWKDKLKHKVADHMLTEAAALDDKRGNEIAAAEMTNNEEAAGTCHENKEHEYLESTDNSQTRDKNGRELNDEGD
ncbi:unnamed protein product [Amaranthus hypochondriacus]